VELGGGSGAAAPVFRSSGRSLGRLEDRADRLFSRRADERTGVDHDRLGVRRILNQLTAGRVEMAEHHLGVDEGLGATEADHTHASARVVALLHG
jgi:hypothetical protein